MWKSANQRENTLSLVLSKPETIELLAVIGNYSMPSAIQEFNIITETQTVFRMVVDNINRPEHQEDMRFEIHLLNEQDDVLLNTHGYEGNALNMYWVDITNPSGQLDIIERWNFVQKKIYE